MGGLTIKTCFCRRDFAIEGSRCPDHCSPDCCRAYNCALAKPPTRNPASRTRRCVVCGRRKDMFPFEAFAPCDENCFRIFTNTPGQWNGGYPRGWHCAGIYEPNKALAAKLHKPAARPRVHKLYCSLVCYYHSQKGHDAKTKNGQRRREDRYWTKRLPDGGSKSATITEMKKARLRYGDGTVSSYLETYPLDLQNLYKAWKENLEVRFGVTDEPTPNLE